MKRKLSVISTAALMLAGGLHLGAANNPWAVDTTEEWAESLLANDSIEIADGFVSPRGESATVRSRLIRFDGKRAAASLTISQSPVWENWQAMENIGPANLGDAPVFLRMGPDNYWMFGRYQGGQTEFSDIPAELEGFDTPLTTTPYPNQYDAPGGRKPGLGGYHAWQSRDMVNWVHHGSVTEDFSVWVTTAEYADGEVYIYYDFPNDQDPHLYIDADLTDGIPGRNMGMAFADPSHGSD